MTAPNHKLSGLDALRGVAILLVILDHFGGMVTGGEVAVVLGNAGVILFFFLSGFLMYWTLSLDPSIKNYAIRRAFRILPIYWLSIFLVAALGGKWSLTQILSNASFTAPLFGYERMLGVYWTLYIEVLFYCIAPVVFFLGTNAVRFAPYAALAALSLVSATRGLGAGAPFYLIFCLCGMQVAAWRCGKLKGIEAAVSIACVSAFFTVLLPIPHYLAVIPLFCAAMLYAALRSTARFVPLEWFGAVSYSWYLLHSIPGYWSVPIAGASLAISIVTYWLIERPAISLGKRLA